MLGELDKYDLGIALRHSVRITWCFTKRQRGFYHLRASVLSACSCRDCRKSGSPLEPCWEPTGTGWWSQQEDLTTPQLHHRTEKEQVQHFPERISISTSVKNVRGGTSHSEPQERNQNLDVLGNLELVKLTAHGERGVVATRRVHIHEEQLTFLTCERNIGSYLQKEFKGLSPWTERNDCTTTEKSIMSRRAMAPDDFRFSYLTPNGLLMDWAYVSNPVMHHKSITSSREVERQQSCYQLLL